MSPTHPSAAPLFARGLRSIPGHEATGIGLCEPILVPLWAMLAWSIPIDSWTLAGGGLILTGLAVRYLPLARHLSGHEKHEKPQE